MHRGPVLVAETSRERRYRRRGLLWDVSDLERVRKCGRVRHDAQGVALRRTGDGVVGYAGLCTCGSVWACPVCNAKVMGRRQNEIGLAVAQWQKTGGQVVMVTLTMRHHRGQRLGDLWDALSAAWNRVTAGKAWLADKARHSIVGWLRAVEVTFGVNGWHVHVHALVFVEPGATAASVRDLQGSMFNRWSRALQRAGLAAPAMVGQDAHLVTGPADRALSEYFTKAVDQVHRIGLELTATQSKEARSAHSTETTWSLLDEVEDTGEVGRWNEWERGSKGRRQLTWSKGLRERLGLRREQTDDEIAAQEVGTRADELAVITPSGYEQLRTSPRDLGTLLDAVALGGDEWRGLLDAWGVDYELRDQ